jgi:hypothetical protein
MAVGREALMVVMAVVPRRSDGSQTQRTRRRRRLAAQLAAGALTLAAACSSNPSSEPTREPDTPTSDTATSQPAVTASAWIDEAQGICQSALDELDQGPSGAEDLTLADLEDQAAIFVQRMADLENLEVAPDFAPEVDAWLAIEQERTDTIVTASESATVEDALASYDDLAESGWFEAQRDREEEASEAIGDHAGIEWHGCGAGDDSGWAGSVVPLTESECGGVRGQAIAVTPDLFVTPAHLVPPSGVVQLAADGTMVDAQAVAVDRDLDVAVLELANSMNSVMFDEVSPGMEGDAADLVLPSSTWTLGIIDAIGPGDVFRTTVASRSGRSGGLVLVGGSPAGMLLGSRGEPEDGSVVVSGAGIDAVLSGLGSSEIDLIGSCADFMAQFGPPVESEVPGG